MNCCLKLAAVYNVLFSSLKMFPHTTLNSLSRVFLITELSTEMLEKQENGAIMCQTSIHCTLIKLNHGVFRSRNFRLIVAPQKFDVFKIQIFGREAKVRGQINASFKSMIALRQKYFIVFIVYH